MFGIYTDTNEETGMEMTEMRDAIEKVRKWALKTGNTKNGLDYRVLYRNITGKHPSSENWKGRKDNADYVKAAYAYGVYAFKGLNNWDEYKRRANADAGLLRELA